MNFISMNQELQRELLLALRGERSQNLINRKLKYKYNQVSKWETGRVNIAWSDFVRLCDVCHVNIRLPLSRILGYQGDPERSDALVKHLTTDETLTEISQKIGCSRSTLSRWISGKTQPHLLQILALVERVGELPHLIANIVDISKIPSLRGRYLEHGSLRDLLASNPFIMKVLHFLELDEYRNQEKHDDEYIAKRLGVDSEKVNSAIGLLTNAKAIKMVGSHYQRRLSALNSGGKSKRDYQNSLAIKRYWLEQALDQMTEPTTGNPAGRRKKRRKFGYLTMSVSKQAAQECAEIIARAYYQISEMAKNEKDAKQCITVVNMQLFDVYTSDDSERR